jgi:hypothetical protein
MAEKLIKGNEREREKRERERERDREREKQREKDRARDFLQKNRVSRIHPSWGAQNQKYTPTSNLRRRRNRERNFDWERGRTQKQASQNQQFLGKGITGNSRAFCHRSSLGKGYSEQARERVTDTERERERKREIGRKVTRRNKRNRKRKEIKN